MEPDDEAFLYPVVDKKKCINCGMCEKVCPILNSKKEEYKEIKAFAVRSRDKENLEASTSGGFFIPLAEYIIEKNGIVCGVGFDDKLVLF